MPITFREPLGSYNKKEKLSLYRGQIYKNPPIAFRGKTEDEFFSSIKDGDEQTALSLLNKINFDITAQDEENGNNVFHYILQNNSELLWQKLNTLLRNIISRIHPENISIALSEKNNQSKLPLECSVDNIFLNKVKEDLNFISKTRNISLVSDETPVTNPVSFNTPTNVLQSPKTIVEKQPVENKKEVQEENLVGNEIPNNVEIGAGLGFFDDFEVCSQTNQKGVFADVIGLESAKKVLEDYVINPINNNKPILVNGILLYGNGNNGKTYLVESLAKELNKEIIGVKKILSLLENSDLNEEERSKILDKYIISISIDDYRDIDNILEYISNNYKRTGRQTIVFIDELAKLFQSDINISGRYSSRDIPEFMRKFDNFSLKGGVLIGTTNDIGVLQADILRSNRFQKKVELKFPNPQERDGVLKKFFGNKLNISDEDYNKIIKKTAGFSYGDLSVIARLIASENDVIDKDTLNEAIEVYAKENNMGKLSDEGTTSNYDTPFLQRKNVTVNFSDVAGMDDVKTVFKKTVLERLKPEVVARFKENKRPVISTNFLLYGPPGTGKTFIVEALSGESKIPMYKIDASTFMDKYVGESEKNLRRIFTQLETKYRETGEYSILFIDEANKILGRRDSANSRDSEYVEQLLQYIDNSFERGIITITATNYKDKMDEAVLSRLGQQIMIGYPDLDTIKSLIKIQLRNIKTASQITDKEVFEIAKCLRGFGSREIKQMITAIVDENLQGDNKQLTLEDFKIGISKYAQSHELPAINERNRTSAYDKIIKRLEISPDDPQSLDDIGGMQEVKEKLLNAVMSSSLKPEIAERYRANKVKGQNGILLYGAPGCGKTYIMKALAAHLDLPIYEFKLSRYGSKWAHETTNNIANVFNQLKEKYRKTGERSILMLDEFEDIASKRDNEINSHRIEEVNALLKEISDAERNGIIVVAATNHYNRIDDAMKRPGRFVSVEVTPPDMPARADIIKKSLSGREIAQNLFEDESNFEILAQKTENFAIVDITETINSLIKEAIDNNVEKLTLKDFETAFEIRQKEKAKEQEINKSNLIM